VRSALLRDLGSRAERSVVPAVRAFGARPEMLAIQSALPVSFAGLVVGLGAFMLAGHGTLLVRFTRNFAAAFGIMSVVLVVLLTANLARRRAVPLALALGCAVATFAVSLPWHATTPYALATQVGSSGLFLAMICALVCVDALDALRRRFGPAGGAALGLLLTVGAAAGLAAAGFSLADLLDRAIAPIGMLGDSLPALLVVVLVECLLWTVGIHGPALLAAVVLPVYTRLQLDNTQAYADHHVLPHIVCVSIFLFVFPGGAGSTLPVALLLLRSKVPRLRKIARVTLLPSLANSNEPLIIGLPLVLNPVLGVPFVVAPLVLAVVTYGALALDLVARPAYYIPYAVPLPISVVLATGDWRAIVLAAVDVAIATAIYAPFVRIYEDAEARVSA